MFLKGVVDRGGQCVTAVLPRRVGTRCAKKSPTTLRQVPGGKSRLSKKSRICRDSWPRHPVPERVMKARGIIRIDEANTNYGKAKIRVGENMDCYVSYLMGRVLGNGKERREERGDQLGSVTLMYRGHSKYAHNPSSIITVRLRKIKDQCPTYHGNTGPDSSDGPSA